MVLMKRHLNDHTSRCVPQMERGLGKRVGMWVTLSPLSLHPTTTTNNTNTTTNTLLKLPFEKTLPSIDRNPRNGKIIPAVPLYRPLRLPSNGLDLVFPNVAAII